MHLQHLGVMNIEINKKVFDNFSKRLRIALIHLHDIDNRDKLQQSQALLDDISLYIKDTQVNQDLIDAWKTQYETSRQYHSVVERYVKLIKNGSKLKGRTVIDNLCMYFTLKYMVPVVADNLSNLEGNVTYNVTNEETEFQGFPVLTNMLFTKDTIGPYSVSGDYWRHERALCNTKSTDVLIRIEMLPPMKAAEFRSLVTEILDMARQFTSGHGVSKILTSKDPKVSFKTYTDSNTLDAQ